MSKILIFGPNNNHILKHDVKRSNFWSLNPTLKSYNTVIGYVIFLGNLGKFMSYHVCRLCTISFSPAAKCLCLTFEGLSSLQKTTQIYPNHWNIHPICPVRSIIAPTIIPLLVHELKDTFINTIPSLLHIGVPAEQLLRSQLVFPYDGS